LPARAALDSLIAFMPTNPNGALGSLDYKKEEGWTLAVKSREASPKFGTPERQKLIGEVKYDISCFLLKWRWVIILESILMTKLTFDHHF